MGIPYEAEAQGDTLPVTPPPTYTTVMGGESVEMVETKDDDGKKNENKEDKEKKEEKEENDEEEGPPAPPPVGLIELVSFS